MKRMIGLLLTFCLLCSGSAFAAKAKPTPTPPPQDIVRDVIDPPEIIQNVIDIAYTEWETLHGKTLPNKGNKYQTWWNNYKWGWCAGFVTWCMLEAGVPQDYEDVILARDEGDVEGIYHCKGSSPSKLIHSYLHMHRTTNIPQKGFIVVYGSESNRWTHVGIVCDVEPLENGKYRLTCIEGNMSNRVKMYIYDYDADIEYSIKKKYPDNTNITAVPEEERTGEIEKNYRTYDLRVYEKNKKKPWYVTCFLMPWVPGET